MNENLRIELSFYSFLFFFISAREIYTIYIYRVVIIIAIFRCKFSIKMIYIKSYKILTNLKTSREFSTLFWNALVAFLWISLVLLLEIPQSIQVWSNCIWRWILNHALLHVLQSVSSDCLLLRHIEHYWFYLSWSIRILSPPYPKSCIRSPIRSGMTVNPDLCM